MPCGKIVTFLPHGALIIRMDASPQLAAVLSLLKIFRGLYRSSRVRKQGPDIPAPDAPAIVCGLVYSHRISGLLRNAVSALKCGGSRLGRGRLHRPGPQQRCAAIGKLGRRAPRNRGSREAGQVQFLFGSCCLDTDPATSAASLFLTASLFTGAA